MISDRISGDIPPKMKPHSNALLQFCLKLNVASQLKPHKAAYHPTKCEVIDDVKLFPTVYRRIPSQILTISKQTSRHKSKCVRIHTISRFFVAFYGR